MFERWFKKPEAPKVEELPTVKPSNSSSGLPTPPDGMHWELCKPNAFFGEQFLRLELKRGNEAIAYDLVEQKDWSEAGLKRIASSMLSKFWAKANRERQTKELIRFVEESGR